MTARLRALTAADMARAGTDPAYLQSLVETPTLLLPHTWHALHFLLCGDAWDGPEPLNHAILGGALLEDDLGPRVLGPDLVARVAAALFPINIPAIVADFRPQEFEAHDIYPGNWQLSPEWPQRFAHDLAALRDFYQERSAAGHGVLILIA